MKELPWRETSTNSLVILNSTRRIMKLVSRDLLSEIQVESIIFILEAFLGQLMMKSTDS